MNHGGVLEVGSASLVVRPNRSLPVAGMAVLLVLLSAQATAVGVGFALAGAWMILPFTGLEIVVVGLLCLWLYRHRNDCELVTIAPERIQVLKRRGNDDRRYDFPRHWTRVTLERPAGRTRPTRVLVGSHGRFVTLGDDINDSERALLATELKRLLQ